MSDYTKGKVAATRWVDGTYGIKSLAVTGRFVGGCPVSDMIGAGMLHDDARRVAAAWNACDTLEGK